MWIVYLDELGLSGVTECRILLLILVQSVLSIEHIHAHVTEQCT